MDTSVDLVRDHVHLTLLGLSQIFQQTQIDECTWNFFNNMTDGSQGVVCPNLDELYLYANDMKKGQKITCRRYLKDMDSSYVHENIFQDHQSASDSFIQSTFILNRRGKTVVQTYHKNPN